MSPEPETFTIQYDTLTQAVAGILGVLEVFDAVHDRHPACSSCQVFRDGGRTVLHEKLAPLLHEMGLTVDQIATTLATRT